jgi:putative endonuclease
MEWSGFVYILTNKNHTVLYTGATNDLHSRLFEHQQKLRPGFTSRYNVNKLVYFECFYEVEQAFKREAQIKSWSRKKKEELIRKSNPEWKDLSPEILIQRSIMRM